MEACGNTTAPIMEEVDSQENNNSTLNETQSENEMEKRLAVMFEWVVEVYKSSDHQHSLQSGYNNNNHDDDHHNS